MVVEEVVTGTSGVFGEIILEVGRLALWLQTLGIIVVLWIIFQIVNFIMHRKRTTAVDQFKKDINRIDVKLSRIERLIKKKSR